MRRIHLWLLFILIQGSGINLEAMQLIKKDRQAAVAGSFYPADPAELRKTIAGFMAAAKPIQTKGLVRAILVPHAGYVFSGGVAASGYNQLNPDQEYKRVFILASSHRVSFGKASVYTQGDYMTPLGRVTVDTDIARELIRNSKAFTDYPEAHISEHSIEVQLPFLQVKLKHPVKIVPIILGTQVPAMCEEIAKALKPYFTKENLFIVSSDFSHYPVYADAVKVDDITAHAFCKNSPEEFLKVIKSNDNLRIPKLATSMCAWPSGLTLLYLTQGNSTLAFNKIDYKNSGDIASYGDKNSVVGYHAISITESKESEFEITSADKRELLRIARSTIDSYATSGGIPPLNPNGYSENLKVKAGAFVTLKIGETLRGCIGTFEPIVPLYKEIQQMAIASSTQDNRFQPVKSKELQAIHIEISVLTPMHKIENISEIQLGKHGIYIKKGSRSGTFLPQVAIETGWSLEEFLGHCAQDKAGIGWTGWKEADIYIYEALIFEEGSPER